MSTTDPREAQVAAIWDAAMGDGHGHLAVRALALALCEPHEARPGAVQDAAIRHLLAPDSDPGPVWLAVASNTLGSMLTEARRILDEQTQTGATA